MNAIYLNDIGDREAQGTGDRNCVDDFADVGRGQWQMRGEIVRMELQRNSSGS